MTAIPGTPADYWQGSLVRLRAIDPADWTHFAAWYKDTDLHRLGNVIAPPYSDEALKAWCVEKAERPTSDNLVLSIETLEGEWIGSINTHGCDLRNANFEYGVGLTRDAMGRGYGSEAVLLLLRYFFCELGYERVSGIVYAFNEPSQRMHERLGFTLEGRIRRYRFTAGEFHDALWYGLLRDEFLERHPGWASQVPATQP